MDREVRCATRAAVLRLSRAVLQTGAVGASYSQGDLEHFRDLLMGRGHFLAWVGHLTTVISYSSRTLEFPRIATHMRDLGCRNRVGR